MGDVTALYGPRAYSKPSIVLAPCLCRSAKIHDLVSSTVERSRGGGHGPELGSSLTKASAYCFISSSVTSSMAASTS